MSALQEIIRQNKICVLIPTYNNAQTLPEVLRDVSLYTKQIILVNDGSTDHTLSVVKDFAHVNLVSYAENRGKGFALRTGFKHAVASGYDYVITIDSDGQHDADDLGKFVEHLQDHPGAIIIGARNMDQASVPGKSSFGNKFSNFWFWVTTGIKRNDTQSGYRLYPVKALADVEFYTNKFEFEIEVLVRAAWAGIDVLEVPVKVYYPEKEKRITHFRPFLDFTRITILNTVLVIIALLFIKPRDLIRYLKKKTSNKSFRFLFLIPLNLIV